MKKISKFLPILILEKFYIELSHFYNTFYN